MVNHGCFNVTCSTCKQTCPFFITSWTMVSFRLWPKMDKFGCKLDVQVTPIQLVTKPIHFWSWAKMWVMCLGCNKVNHHLSCSITNPKQNFGHIYSQTRLNFNQVKSLTRQSKVGWFSMKKEVEIQHIYRLSLRGK